MSEISTIVRINDQPLFTQAKIGQAIKLGKEKPQAPTGKYTARCVHVEPNWTYLKNRKVALYFEIDEGLAEGHVARRFYPLKKLHDGTYEIAPKSKFMTDIKALFPHELNAGEIDPVTLFYGKFFNIEVELKRSNGNTNAIVTSLSLFDSGW